jgi:hypothetical protein
MWLASKKTLLAFKKSSDLPPLGLRLAPNVFLLIIQIKYQRETLDRLGIMIGIDTTHNTTQYERVSLFTIIVRDHWGHGKYYYLVISPLSFPKI